MKSNSDSDLHCIRTTLSQNGNEHAFDQNCKSYHEPLNFKLEYMMMALGISTYHVGLNSDISGDTCTSECSALDTKTVISNMKWTLADAYDDMTYDMDSIAGNYEVEGYDVMDDWHYVTISVESDGVYKWANRAGVEWRLTQMPNA